MIMKKLSLLMFSIIVAGGMLFTSCTDEDTTAPVITIIGDNPVDHLLTTDYFDEGATAQDDEDGNLVVEVTSDVDVDQIGTYFVTYRATDNSGNVGTAERTVNVIVKQISFEFTWAVVDTVTGPGAGIYDYNSEINASATDLNKILIGNFGGFGNSVIVSATFDKFGNITIANQNLVGVPAGSEGSVSGNGMISLDGESIHITYTINYNAGGTDVGNATFTKL